MLRVTGASLSVALPRRTGISSGQTAVAGRAYWVFASRRATHILTGLRTPQPPIPADGLYAPVADSAIPGGHTAWTYSNGIWRRVPANSALEAGRGYLLYAE
jgi:hypothetical protein